MHEKQCICQSVMRSESWSTLNRKILEVMWSNLQGQQQNCLKVYTLVEWYMGKNKLNMFNLIIIRYNNAIWQCMVFLWKISNASWYRPKSQVSIVVWLVRIKVTFFSFRKIQCTLFIFNALDFALLVLLSFNRALPIIWCKNWPNKIK